MPRIIRTLAVSGAAAAALMGTATVAQADTPEQTTTAVESAVDRAAGTPVTLPSGKTMHVRGLDTVASGPSEVKLAAVGEAPAAAPSEINVQLGAGAIALGILVVIIVKVKDKRWALAPVICAFAVGTVLAGAGGLLGMPGDLTNQLITALGSSLGAM